MRLSAVCSLYMTRLLGPKRKFFFSRNRLVNPLDASASRQGPTPKCSQAPVVRSHILDSGGSDGTWFKLLT